MLEAMQGIVFYKKEPKGKGDVIIESEDNSEMSALYMLAQRGGRRAISSHALPADGGIRVTVRSGAVAQIEGELQQMLSSSTVKAP